MKRLFDFKRFSFYIWVGLAYLSIWLINAAATHKDEFSFWALNEIWRSVYIVFAIYFFFEYVIPNLSSKRIFRSILLMIFQILIFSIGRHLWRELGIALNIHTAFIDYETLGESLGSMMSSSIMSVLFFGIIKFVYEHYRLKQAAQQLKIEKQQAELNYLKSQTNPHFLFNTLNNIYALSRDKSDLAPESIMRLSKILRYMLYETSGDFVSIEQELKIMDDYIALEKLRYDDSLRINFNHDVEDVKQALPPLLLIPLVENAFKHGVSETRGLPYVDIHLSVKARQLLFIVKNSSEGGPNESGIKENIGLSNLRRQLELLYKDYELKAEQGNDVFTATLKINLASHV